MLSAAVAGCCRKRFEVFTGHSRLNTTEGVQNRLKERKSTRLLLGSFSLCNRLNLISVRSSTKEKTEHNKVTFKLHTKRGKRKEEQSNWQIELQLSQELVGHCSDGCYFSKVGLVQHYSIQFGYCSQCKDDAQQAEKREKIRIYVRGIRIKSQANDKQSGMRRLTMSGYVH